jgi:hypothetical protein
VKKFFKAKYNGTRKTPKFIALDNATDDDGSLLQKLRDAIFSQAKKQSHWGEERPAQWLVLEEILATYRYHASKTIISQATYLICVCNKFLIT